MRGSYGLLISQAMAEYEDHCAGRRRSPVKVLPAPSGQLQYCGDVEDPSRWSVAYVRAVDQAITPLAVGDLDHVHGVLTQLDQEDVPIEDPRALPPPTVRVRGASHHFSAMHGNTLIGAVQLQVGCILLAAVGRRLAVVYAVEGVPIILDIKSPLDLREVDVDGMLDFLRSADPVGGRSGERVLVTPDVRAHHVRIVCGTPIDVGDGPPVSKVLQGCFADIARRARAQQQSSARLKGKRNVSEVLDALLQLGLRGSGDLVGRVSDLVAEIQQHVPDFALTAEAFADALNLLRATGTCLVERQPGPESGGSTVDESRPPSNQRDDETDAAGCAKMSVRTGDRNAV